MNNGWIKIHRKILDNCIFKDSELYHLFSYCLLRANHKEQKIIFNKQELTIERGQFVTGRNVIHQDTKIKTGNIYNKLKILQNLKIIDIKSNNKFSLITVLKYNTYQDMITTSSQQNEQQVNNKLTTSSQQDNTNKNIKKEKNDKNEVGKDKKTFTNIPPSIADIIKRGMELKYSGIEREAERFFNHYESNGWKVGKNPMKNWSASLCNWYKNINQFNSNGIYKPKDLEPEKF